METLNVPRLHVYMAGGIGLMKHALYISPTVRSWSPPSDLSESRSLKKIEDEIFELARCEFSQLLDHAAPKVQIALPAITLATVCLTIPLG